MAGVPAFGSKLYIGTKATGTAVVNITNISGPGLSTETIDMTAHDSAGSYRENTPTFISGGEVTLQVNWNPNSATHGSGAGGLINLWENKTRQLFAIEFPTTTPVVWNFYGYVTGFTPGAPFDDKLTAAVTILVDGAMTWAGT